MTNRVPPTGPLDAKIAIVGDSPGDTEVREGEPFVGNSGKLLNQLLRLSGIARTECYLTNIAKKRPKGNNFKARYYSNGQPTSELKIEIMKTREELRDINPNLILTLGNEAMKAITGKEGIDKYRGSILDSPIGKVIPTYHPSKVFHYWKRFPYTLIDFNRASEDMKFPELRIPDYTLYTNPTYDLVTGKLEEIRDSADKVAFDIECTGKWIDMISLCWGELESICIPFLKIKNKNTVTSKPYWSSHQERKIWEMLAEILGSRDIGKIAQNANFDIAFMQRYGIPTNNLWMDTMNAQHTVYPELKKGLDTLQSIYTRIPYHKDMMSSDRQQYNALDSLATYHAAMGLEEELKDFNMHDFYHNYVKKMVRDYRKLSDRGIRIDMERKQELEEIYQKKENELQEQINNNCPWELDSNYENVDLNPRSPDQLMEYFYEKRNYYTYRKNGKPTTNKEALERLARKYPDDPIPELVLESRKIRKTLGTYIRVPVDPDERLRCTIKVSGTVTGRTACGKSINGTGTNLQNIQKGEARSMFIPSHSDWVLTEGDYSGADAMVVAYISRDPGLIKLFKDPKQDYHATNTYLFFNCEVPNPNRIAKTDVPPELRQKSKAISHGSNYGRSSSAIALDLRKSRKEIKAKQDRYFTNYPGIKQWHREVKNKLKNKGILENCFGRKRHFFRAFRGRKMSPNILFQAYSYNPQSTVGDLTHKGFLNLKEALPENFPANILMTIHDSILVENDPNYQEELEKIMEEAMTIPFEVFGRECIIPVDFETANNWSDL